MRTRHALYLVIVLIGYLVVDTQLSLVTQWIDNHSAAYPYTWLVIVGVVVVVVVIFALIGARIVPEQGGD